MLPTNHAYIATVVVLVALSRQTTCDTDVCGMIRYGPTANGVNISVKTDDIMVCDICNSQTNSIADTLNKQQTLCGKHAFSLSIPARVLYLIAGQKTTTHTTTTVLRPFVRDYPGEPVPEETLTHPPS